MKKIKLTSWNIEHFSKLLPDPNPGSNKKLSGIAREIQEMDPDILCIVEGPGNLPDLRDWVNSPQGLSGAYIVVTIPGTDAILAQNPPNPRQALQKLYGMQGTDNTGNQWIWFLVKNQLFQDSGAKLISPADWQNLTGQKKWNFHKWGDLKVSSHSHWRHPQTLVMKLDGTEIEIIGVHLKSKINQKQAFDANGNLTAEYVDEGMIARIKLATEASDIRNYIEHRYNQEPGPRIFVCGDMNDGPGRGYFEREFLYFDLVSNIQGDVFFARRFLNHALFDYDERFRWSTQFTDKIESWSRQQPGAENIPAGPLDTTRFQLIDHILFTQTLVGQQASPRVEPHAGWVEHTIHQRINSTLSKANRTSDHLPVSVLVTYGN